VSAHRNGARELEFGARWIRHRHDGRALRTMPRRYCRRACMLPMWRRPDSDSSIASPFPSPMMYLETPSKHHRGRWRSERAAPACTRLPFRPTCGRHGVVPTTSIPSLSALRLVGDPAATPTEPSSRPDDRVLPGIGSRVAMAQRCPHWCLDSMCRQRLCQLGAPSPRPSICCGDRQCRNGPGGQIVLSDFCCAPIGELPGW
jgi:hypothetical protein